jgi:hypothetical protein
MPDGGAAALLDRHCADAFGAMVAHLAGWPVAPLPQLPGRRHVLFAGDSDDADPATKEPTTKPKATPTRERQQSRARERFDLKAWLET